MPVVFKIEFNVKPPPNNISTPHSASCCTFFQSTKLSEIKVIAAVREIMLSMYLILPKKLATYLLLIHKKAVAIKINKVILPSLVIFFMLSSMLH